MLCVNTTPLSSSAIRCICWESEKSGTNAHAYFHFSPENYSFICYLQRLIEYTPANFSDNALLIEARNAIHRLAVRVNTVQADGQDESMVDGTKLLARLLAPAVSD